MHFALCATSGDDSAAVRPSVQHNEAGINLHANLVDYTELEITKVLARHSVEIGLPKHYTRKSSGAGGQDARHWNQGQENIIDKSCLDCEVHFTTIFEKCADADVLYKPRTKH